MLPAVVNDGVQGRMVVDRDTGELVVLREASDRQIVMAAAEVARLDHELLEAKRALAAELRQRHGVGTTHAGGFRFTVSESQSWPVRATDEALDRLLREGVIGDADVIRCMPSRPKPDARQLKALLGRLMVSDPDAARVLSGACTVSPPRVADLEPDAVDGEAAS